LPRKPVLKLEDIQRDDGTPCSAGGWILDRPLPKRPNINFLTAAHEACLASLDFYSIEFIWHPSLIFDPRPDEFDKQRELKQAKKHIWDCTAKLWEICQLIAAVTEKDAHKELKDFRAGKRPDIAEKLHAMGFCSEEDLAAYKASSPAKRKKLLKIELPPMGPEDPF